MCAVDTKLGLVVTLAEGGSREGRSCEASESADNEQGRF